MKVSVSLTNYSGFGPGEPLAETVAAVASAVDERPLDTLWVPDHLLQADPSRDLDEPMLEAYATLGYLAATTRRVRLGTMVGWAAIRPPAVIVKAITTLDVLSQGRAWLGLGAGYQAGEARMMGLPFPPTAARFDHLEDVLQLASRMWMGDESPIAGKLHQFERPICRPAPIRGGGPPILIGGMGEKRTLPLVARYGDACNLFDIPDGGATISRKLAVLAEACDAIGRDGRAIEVTVSTRLDEADTAESFARKCATLADYGVDHVVVMANGRWDPPRLDVLAEASSRIQP